MVTFWVGKIDGGIFLYDEDLQFSGSKYLKLWSFGEESVESFEVEEAKKKC